MIAKEEAKSHGCEEAILLDGDSYVCEGSAENIFIVKNGVLKTPPLSSPILDGITRDAIIWLARNRGSNCAGLETQETLISLGELYTADEAFFTGTAAEVCPIREVDGRVIGHGKRGPIAKELQKLYFDTVRGKIHHYNYEKYQAELRNKQDWLTYV